jgi:hypothetical protein
MLLIINKVKKMNLIKNYYYQSIFLDLNTIMIIKEISSNKINKEENKNIKY